MVGAAVASAVAGSPTMSSAASASAAPSGAGASRARAPSPSKGRGKAYPASLLGYLSACVASCFTQDAYYSCFAGRGVEGREADEPGAGSMLET